MYHLNINSPIINFQKTLRRKIYVDKSLLIKPLNELIGTGECYVCITRPRRFGKTINANMLGAYYTKGYDSHELFQGLAISEEETYPQHLNRHNVIYIDFSRMPDICCSYQDYISNILSELRNDLIEAYPALRQKEYTMISRMLLDSGQSFIFILDEWDSVFHEEFMGEKEKNSYLKFLKGLLKDQPYVELAYMTGVLPVAKYSSGSELNMFREYNFMNDHIYEAYFGLREAEVKALCKTHTSVSYQELKHWYDGYYTSDGGSLFNPRSVNCALSDGVCLNYWTETGPMNEVADCIEHNVDEVREDIVKLVAGLPVEVELQGYAASDPCLNTRDEILSAMVVYGFLSYHDGALKIPNYELMEKYQKVLARDSMGEVKQIVDCSREMLQATVRRDEERVAAILEEVHDREIPFLNYHDENSLSCMITLCYLYARKDYEIEREAKSGKGYCDYLFRPRKKGLPAIILELKMGKSCEEAIAQIKARNYMQRIQDWPEILLVGINYDEEKHHTCRIETWKHHGDNCIFRY